MANKQAADEDRARFFADVDAHLEQYIEVLTEAVAIPSISAEAARRPDCFRMVDWFESRCAALGVTHLQRRELGEQSPGLKLPPILLGSYYGKDVTTPDPRKRTVCVYGHLDVQPAAREDGWATDPFVLTRVAASCAADGRDAQYGDLPSGGHLFGRGSTDDKGPVLSWLWAIEAHQRLGIELPVNVLFLVECMEESGSLGLDGVVVAEFAKGGYLEHASAVCIADNYWLGLCKPAVQYGLRGLCYFFVHVNGPAKDLHSGRGGSVDEPMNDLMALLGGLVGPKGEILVPGACDGAPDATSAAEQERVASVDFSLDGHKAAMGVSQLRHEGDKAATLLGMWRKPNLSIHGVEGCHSGAGAKTVIPAHVIGKFSIRLAAGQDPEHVAAAVEAHLTSAFAKLGTSNELRVECPDRAPAFGGDPDDFNYCAARRANASVWGVEPDLTCSGGSIPITAVLQATGRSVVLLPIGRADDGAHSQNEKYDVNNLLAGVKLCGAYLHEIAAAPGGQGGAAALVVAPAKKRKVVKYDRCKCGLFGFQCQRC